VPVAIAEKIFSRFAGLVRLKFRKMAFVDMRLKGSGSDSSRWRITLVDSAADGCVHALFLDVFGVRKPQLWWSWKYDRGRGLAFGAWRGDVLVAHYAGFPRQVFWNGSIVPALQVGDVMVKASERGVLTRRGAFQRCAAAFLERYVGFGQTYLLAFGFPNLRALKLAEHLGLYVHVDRMAEIEWPPLADRPRWRSRVRDLRLERDGPAVECLWRTMTVDLSNEIVGVRDLDYLCHRYVRHPEHDYRMFVIEARFTRQALGVIVLRREGERWLWVDWVGRLAALSEAVSQARRLAGRFDAPLYTWASTALAARLVDSASSVTPLDVYIPSCAWTSGPEPKELEGRWWLMAGDTDFF